MARPKKTSTTTTPTPEPTAEVVATPDVTTTPTKPKRSRLAVKTSTFNIFDQDTIQKTRDALAKASMADGFKSAAELQRDYLPIPWMALQYAIGRIGWANNSINEFIGQENIGKSSLIFSILGHFAQYNIPSFYLTGEPKVLESDWLKRLVSTNPVQAEKILQVLEVSEQFKTLDDIDRAIKKWVSIKRNDLRIPFEIPLVIAIDPISKLLDPQEAGVLIDSKEQKAALDKGISDIGSQPGVNAKWMHAWSRNLNSLMNDYNVTVFLVAGQNDKIGGMATFGDGGASLNKTRPGGQAMNQVAASQITLTHRGMLKNSKGDDIGGQVRLRTVKNSYGPKREIVFHLVNDYHVDTDTYLQPAIDMDEAICNILASRGIFGTTVTRKRYSCPKFNVVNATAAEFSKLIHNTPEITQAVGLALKISGYEAEG